MSLGERIKKQRKNCGMSQEKVAELVGVSRQAVTKWETEQSAPSTENLFKLAEIFGITVDILLESGEQEKNAPAEQIYYLYKMEEAKKADELRAKRKRNLFMALAVLGGYIVIYLLGRIFGTTSEQTSVMGWLFGTDPKQMSYLYGWLLHQNLYWFGMIVSVIPALFGKYRFSFTTLSMFGIGLLVGELFGGNPAGAAYGQNHYGWAIWGGIFILSLIMGVVLEHLSKQPLTMKSKKVWIWCAILLIGIIAIVLLVRGSIPQVYGS